MLTSPSLTHLGVTLNQPLLHDLDGCFEPNSQLSSGVCAVGPDATASRSKPLSYVTHDLCHPRFCVGPHLRKLRVARCFSQRSTSHSRAST